jgi:ABC-type Fe3+ transport system permease subunit
MALLMFAFRSQFLPASPTERPHSPSTGTSLLVWGTAIAACLAGFGVPLAIVGAGVPAGLTSVLRNRQMLEEITVALGFGLASGILAALAAAALLRCAGVQALACTAQPEGWTPTVRRVATLGCVLLCMPGMLGSLTVSLGLLWLFQWPVLHAAYDTPLPAVLALVLFLLPRGLLLLLLFEAVTPQYSVHAARLLRAAPDRPRRAAAAELLWQMRSRRLFFVFGLLSVWGYLELTPVSILAPPGLTSAPVRLYNLMHYGRSMVLSAMVMLTMLAPLGLFVVATLVRKPLLHGLVYLPFRRERP